MGLSKIAGAALAGTTAMTLFSYAVSDARNKQFREPEILAKLIKRLLQMQDKTTAKTEAGRCTMLWERASHSLTINYLNTAG